MLQDKQGKQLLGEMERAAGTGVSWKEIVEFEGVLLQEFADWVDKSAERRERFAKVRKESQNAG